MKALRAFEDGYVSMSHFRLYLFFVKVLVPARSHKKWLLMPMMVVLLSFDTHDCIIRWHARSNACIH